MDPERPECDCTEALNAFTYRGTIERYNSIGTQFEVHDLSSFKGATEIVLADISFFDSSCC
jgi:hypothetical protein